MNKYLPREKKDKVQQQHESKVFEFKTKYS